MSASISVRSLLLLLAFAPLASTHAAPPKSSSAPTLTKIVWDDEELESRWSWHATLIPQGNGSAAFAISNAAKSNLLSVTVSKAPTGALQFQIVKQTGKQTAVLASATKPLGQGEVTVSRLGGALRILWNGELVAQTKAPLPGNNYGLVASGWKWGEWAMQPTEVVTFRDDFMRAEGPDSPEIPGEWKVAGVWKTSGTLGPRSDAELNPNPFVFRASGDTPNAASAGKWFWNDYVVSASVHAHQEDENAPLVASLEAFEQKDGRSIRGEVDFRTGIASIKLGDKVLATSAPFDAAPEEWHRMRLDPGPGVARLYFDGVECVRANTNLAQGEVSLRARTGGGNFVDFDDVRVGPAQGSDKVWGEGPLPERFRKDRLMQYWANAASLWKRDGNGTWWNTGDFFKEANLTIPVPKWTNGQGAAILLGAQNEKTAAATAELNRTSAGRYQLQLKSSLAKTVASKDWAPTAIEGHPLTFKLVPAGAAAWKVEAWQGGKLLLSCPSPAPRGTKVGVVPQLNERPLPPPRLEALKVSSQTMERDGHTAIGVNITPVTPEIQKSLGLPDASGAIIDNVEKGSPAENAGIKNGDVVRGINGARVADVETMQGAVGAAKPGARIQVEVLRLESDGSKLDWSNCVATTPDVLDYSFTSAPVDWRPARGIWQVSERWTCSPQWSFFSGQNDEAPLLWSRFALKGDWTLEAYLATPMDLARGERMPTNINISIGDGKSLASGYSFLLGAKERTLSQIRKGDAVVWEKPYDLPAGVGDTHQDWVYCRLEKRKTLDGGVRFKWTVNGREIATWTDKSPLEGRHLAFWSVNGGLSIARVRLWHSGLEGATLQPHRAPQVEKSKLVNALGNWSPRGNGREASAQLHVVGDGGKPALEIENPHNGGDWTVYATRAPFDPKTLEWDYKLNPGTKVNLYAKVDDQWQEIAFAAGVASPDSNQPTLGQVEGVKADGQWHKARFDLKQALENHSITADKIQALAFAAPSQDYLRAGLGGNRYGATYWLRGLKVVG